MDLESLNPSQREAVQHTEGPLLILAGPGSGKTRVITHRIANMIQNHGIRGSEVAALTFTNKAADEMRHRIEQMVPDAYVWTGTFHRFCSRLLRRYASLAGLQENFTIYDSSDSIRMIKQAMEKTGAKDSRYRAESFANEISRAKSACVGVEQFEKLANSHLQQLAVEVYREYQKLLLHSNASDFDDLLLHIVNILHESPELRQQLDEHFKYILVDEYQDTNIAQYAIVRALSLDFPNLAVTGDPDQSIYSWRGANIRNILEFESDYPDAQTVRLEDNYRSTKSILRVADQLIVNNQNRKHKTLRTENAEGDPVRLVAYSDQKVEADMIAEEINGWLRENIYQPDEIAIFYRANWLSRSLEHALRASGVPYQIVNGYEFYQRREIKDLMGYLHLLNNPNDNVAFLRVINTPSRKIGKVTLQRLQVFADECGYSLLDAARQSGMSEIIKKQAASKLAGFVALYDRIAIDKTENVERLLQAIIEETGYVDFLLADDSPEAHERAGNVEELVLAAREFDMAHPEDGGLEAYLEQTSLVNDVDAWDSSGASVTLMTLHAAKGLEFPAVFLVGLEEGLIPHERSSVDPDEVEEERRLLFVGMTRAKQNLYLSRCLTRFKRGRNWPVIPSRFLMELPRAEMEISEPKNLDYSVFKRSWNDNPDESWTDEDEIDIAHSVDAGDDSEIPFSLDDLIEQPVYKNEADERPEQTRETPAENALSKLGAQVFVAQDLVQDDQESQSVLPDGSVPAHHLKNGQQVFHPTYGRGQVLDVTGEGKKQLAQIEFDTVGVKKIKPAYSNLVRLGN